MGKDARSIEIVASGVPAPRWRARLSSFCATALQSAGYKQWEIAVLLCGDERIRELNGKYRGKDAPTDVLSFPRDEGRKGEPVAGDIAISLPALERNAAAFGVGKDEELKRLVVHGILHLAGMDHGRGKSGRMLALQETLLERLDAEHVIGE
jgi:probable rRNA maturation factor